MDAILRTPSPPGMRKFPIYSSALILIMIVKPTFLGREGVPHAWIRDSAYAKAAEVDAIHNLGQDSVSTSASLDQSHLYTHANTGPDFSASSVPSIPSTFTVGQYGEGTSRNWLIRSPQAAKKRAAASSRSSGRPTGTREAPEQSYSCAICGKEYAQIQGVMRHCRTKHHPSSCLFCDFKWGRPEHYRNHLTKRHELEVAVVNGILGKAAGSRRRTTVIGRNLPQNVLPPAIKHVRRTRPKPRQHRLIPPLSSVAHVSSALSSTQALARPVNDVATFPGCCQRDESTFADRSSSQVTALISTLTPPDGGDNMGSLAVAASDRMFVPSTRAIHSYPVSAAGHAEIRTNTYY